MTEKTEAELQTWRQLKVFLGEPKSANAADKSRAAIYLLKYLPSARNAVFEYLESIFDECVKMNRNSPSSVENSKSGDDHSGIVQEIHVVLYGFIRSNPTVWAPFISNWSLRLLGILSKKYGNEIHSSCNGNLLEVLQRWLGCPPMRSLIDLTSHCVSQLVNINPDMCIDSLLEISVLYAPYFDWVVAHLGSCFPQTVITRVLACGLKDFIQQDDTAESSRVPKLVSVVGILGHLAGHNATDIRKALISMIRESLVFEPNLDVIELSDTDISKMATIPYLLQLARMSELLLTSLVAEYSFLLAPETLNRLSDVVPIWRRRKIAGSGSLLSDIVKLLLRCGHGEHHAMRTIITTLVSFAAGRGPTDLKPQVRSAIGAVLDQLLVELQSLVYSNNGSRRGELPQAPLLNALVSRLSDVHWHMLETYADSSSESQVASTVNDSATAFRWALELATLVCVYSPERTKILSHLICFADSPNTFRDVIMRVETSHPNVLSDTLCCLMAELKSGRIEEPKRLIANLTQLVSQCEIGDRAVSVLARFSETLANQVSSCNNLADANSLVHLLAFTLHPYSLPLTALFRVVSENVSHFFDLISSNVSDPERDSRFFHCLDLFSAVCVDSNAQEMALRSLAEGALSEGLCDRFGSLPLPPSKAPILMSTEQPFVSLLKENAKFATSISFPQSHSSIMRVGVIGRGLRNVETVTKTSKEDAFVNRQFLLEAIQCCIGSGKGGFRSLALLLVELVSTDVMYNGLPWPDEEFSKTTIERDLKIKASFCRHPVLYDLLHLLATRSPPALCVCSVLLRAIMAVQLRHWRNSLETSLSQNPKELEITKKLLELMSIAQLLPPPLSLLPRVLPLLSPHEASCVLEDVWAFMYKHVPTPAAYDKRTGSRVQKFELPVDKRYTERLRICLMSRVEKCGAEFATLFCQDSLLGDPSCGVVVKMETGSAAF